MNPNSLCFDALEKRQPMEVCKEMDNVVKIVFLIGARLKRLNSVMWLIQYYSSCFLEVVSGTGFTKIVLGSPNGDLAGFLWQTPCFKSF